MTRYKFVTLKRIEDDPQFFHHVSTRCTAELPPELCEEAALRWRALAFQWHARQYVESFARLRETVLSIRERLQHYFSTRKLLLETKDLGDAGTPECSCLLVCAVGGVWADCVACVCVWCVAVNVGVVTAACVTMQ